MTEQDLQHAEKKPRRRGISSIWIVPIIAVAIGAWMIYYNISTSGPKITLIMTSADGILAEKTLIKARSVEVGRVESMRLSDDLSHVVVTARMNKDAERLLKNDTRFWVVKPRIGREGISGLGTLWYGAYIELLPGEATESRRRFEVLDEPPVVRTNAEGLRLQLQSSSPDRLSVGDPVIYRGLGVGRIESSDFDAEQRQMHYGIFIEQQYSALVTENTRFWSASGVSLELSASGMRVDVGTIESLIGGGVTFGVPKGVPPGEPVADNTIFRLYDSEDSAYHSSFDQYLEYVLLIDDSVRGLKEEAAVEYRGVRIGTVMQVPYQFTPERVRTMSDIKIPVLIRIEPQRLDPSLEQVDLNEWSERYQRLFAKGLRASLKTGNLLTGSAFVDIGFYEDTEAVEYEQFADKPVFPSVPSRLTRLDQKLSEFMEKINNLQIEPLIEKLNGNLETSQALLDDMRKLSSKVVELLESEDVQALPGDIRSTLEDLSHTLGDLSNTLNGLTPGSPAYQSVTDILQRLEKMMNDFQPFIQTLNKQPNALLFNKQPVMDPKPQAPASVSD